MQASDRRQRVTADKVAGLLRMLVDGPCTRAQLVDALGLDPSTVSKWIAAMREAELVRLCDWQNNARGYPTVELFRWAPGEPDAVKTVRSQAERVRDWRAARKGGVVA